MTLKEFIIIIFCSTTSRNMNEPTKNIENGYCGNCHYSIGNAKYCSKCGQKNTDGRISIGEFFSVVFSTVFNLESKFFQTMRDIFRPGKLTQEWFKGRHKPYFHPVRLFIVTALLLIAALSPFIAEDSGFMIDNYEQAKQENSRKKFITEINNYSTIYLDDKSSKNTIDSLVKKMKESKISFRHKLKKKERKIIDVNSLKNKSAEEIIAIYQDELGSAFTDSIINAVKSKRRLTQDSVKLSNFQMFMDDKDLNRNIANEDFLDLTPEEIADKYQIEGFYKRLLFRQKIRLLKSGKNLLPFILGNSLWVALLMMPFLAIILKLLYIRHDYYYVEHLIFSFHTHSFAFILFTIICIFMNMVFMNMVDIHPFFVFFGFFLLFIYLYKSLRKVYQQGRFKTILKLLFANIIYVFLFSGFAALGFIVGIFLF